MAVLPGGDTVLVGQWRHAWDEHSWELPAGTIEEGEEPLACAQRELREEAGLEAASWASLGTARGTAASTVRFHLFLAAEVTGAERAPEGYEQDMTVKTLPLREALAAAFAGEIQHGPSVAALIRAAHRLGAL